MIEKYILLFFDKVLSFSLKYPKTVVFISICIAVIFAIQIPNLMVNSDLKSLIPEDEVYQEDASIRDQFDIKEYIILAIHDYAGVLNDITISQTDLLIDSIENLKGVVKIRSLFSQDNIQVSNENLFLDPFISTEEINYSDLKNEIEEFEDIKGIFTSYDLKALSLLIEIDESVIKKDIYYKIKNIANFYFSKKEIQVHLSGMPVFEGVLGNYILLDLVTMLPVVAIVLIVLLLIAFRSIKTTIICLVEVIIVIIVTLGIMSSCNTPLLIIQAIMPVIIMGLAVADEVHIFSEFFHQIRLDPSQKLDEAIWKTMHNMYRPVFLTSVTTSMAFLSFIFASMVAMENFGIYTAIGIMLAMLFSLITTPAFIKLLFSERSITIRQTREIQFKKFALNIYKHKNLYRIIVVSIVLISIFGITRIYIQDSWIDNFNKNSDISVSNKFVDKNMAGSMPLYIEITTLENGDIKNPDFLRNLDLFQKDIAQYKDVGAVFSIVEALKKIHMEFTGEKSIPKSINEIGQYIFLLEGSDYEDFWDKSQRSVIINVFIKNANYLQGLEILKLVDDRFKHYFPELKKKVGGHYSLNINWVGLSKIDQPQSLLISFSLILFICILFFKSIKKSLIVFIPVLIAVLMNYGLMGIFDISLGVAASMFSSIVLGIGIDFSIHLQNSYYISRKRHGNRSSLIAMFQTSGKAVVWDTIIVCGGFFTLVLSIMPPIVTLGILVCFGVFTSFIASFISVPLLLSKNK